MKRHTAIWTLVYTVLVLAAFSIPFTNINSADGRMSVEYGLPVRWLTVERSQPIVMNWSPSMQWWKTDQVSFSLPGFVGDAILAALVGSVLATFTVRFRRKGVTSSPANRVGTDV